MELVVTGQRAVRPANVFLMALSAPMLMAAVVLPMIGRLYLAVFEAPAGAGPAWIAVTAILIEALPPFMLAWSVFGLVRVLSEYGAGRFVSLRAGGGLMHAGAGGVVALILQVLAPVGLAALHGQSLWPALNPNMFDLTVMMFATGLLLIGSALEAAARELQSEHDQIV